MCACIGKHALSDLYYEYVDCSNACRVAYLSKVEITEKYKARVNKITTNKVSSAMDQAMDKLSREMVSLIKMIAFIRYRFHNRVSYFNPLHVLFNNIG